jgi:hypothetical protein
VRSGGEEGRRGGGMEEVSWLWRRSVGCVDLNDGTCELIWTCEIFNEGLLNLASSREEERILRTRTHSPAREGRHRTRHHSGIAPVPAQEACDA